MVEVDEVEGQDMVVLLVLALDDVLVLDNDALEPLEMRQDDEDEEAFVSVVRVEVIALVYLERHICMLDDELVEVIHPQVAVIVLIEFDEILDIVLVIDVMQLDGVDEVDEVEEEYLAEIPLDELDANEYLLRGIQQLADIM